ncbi:hypothetical protein COLO4_26479 [Corchorus olitorius]|uniref:Uncharacterized protein n=1 Tax=Corchorus olitorius TaxID=93759 RepID=A0A1R3HX58_9ROSI|nr:hypothetical protein COLO4_26479 [Corchorus olitorius]
MGYVLSVSSLFLSNSSLVRSSGSLTLSLYKKSSLVSYGLLKDLSAVCYILSFGFQFEFQCWLLFGVGSGIKPDDNPRSPVHGEGSFRERSKTAVTPFRRLRLEGGCDRRDGKQALSAPSVVGDTDSVLQEVGRRFQNHVDSLILHGRKVAREIVAEDGSCEIISNFRGKVAAVAGNVEGGEDGAGTSQQPEKIGELLTGVLSATAKPRNSQIVVKANKGEEFTENGLMRNIGLRSVSGPDNTIPGIGPYVGQANFINVTEKNKQSLGGGGPILGQSELGLGATGQSNSKIREVGQEAYLGCGVESAAGPVMANQGSGPGAKKLGGECSCYGGSILD